MMDACFEHHWCQSLTALIDKQVRADRKFQQLIIIITIFLGSADLSVQKKQNELKWTRSIKTQSIWQDYVIYMH